MAEEAPRLTIPTVVNAIDELAYGSNAGYPTHAALGRQLARNDRTLHANLRRPLLGQAFPLNQTLAVPAAGFLNGALFGPWDVECTPGIRAGSWRIRAVLQASATLIFVPFVEGLWPFAGKSDLNALQDALTDGGGAAETVYGPYSIPLREGPLRVGFVLYSGLVGTADTTGAVLEWGPNFVRAAGATFAGLGDPTLTAIRLADGAGSPITGYSDIVAVEGRVAANDTAIVYPPFPVDVWPLQAVARYGYRAITKGDIYSVMLRETPLSGNLAEAVR